MGRSWEAGLGGWPNSDSGPPSSREVAFQFSSQLSWSVVKWTGIATGATRWGWDLDADTSLVADARHRIGELLTSWGCDALIADAQLVVTELLTNSILHAESACRVTLELSPEGLRIEVTDRDPSPPEPQPFDREREGGRGLLIVGTLASAWGIEQREGGKTVWAELAV